MIDGNKKKWLPVAVALAIAVASFVVFLPVLQAGFILWDDNIYIYQDEILEQPFFDAASYFFGPHFFIGNYHPITMMLYWLLYHIAGKEPMVFHAASVVIHVVNVLLVFWFAWLLSGRKLMVAAITSLFFGIHPMHVESVAWAAELKDVLYTAFFISGLITYVKYLEPGTPLQKKRRVSLLLLTFIFFIFSVLSKPAAVIFPLLLWVIDFYRQRRMDKQMILEKLPFIVMAFVFGIIAILAQREDHLLHNYYPFSLRIVFASYSYLAYIVKLVIPIRLVNIYPYPALHNGYAPLYFYFAPVFICLLVYSIYRTAGYARRILAFGFLFYFVTIVLELQLISVGDAIMAERYTYVPYIGLFFALALYVHFLWHNGKAHIKMIRQASLVVLVVTFVMFGTGSYTRCKAWISSETIASDLYSKHPEAPTAAHNMGAVMYNSGKFREAIPFFAAVKNDKGEFAADYLYLANSYIAVDQPDSAYKVIKSAWSGGITDNNREYYLTLGCDMLANHSYEPAVKFLSVYTRLQKDDARGYIALAECYYMLHMHSSYINTVDSGLKYCAPNYNLLNHKGYALFAEGKYSAAIPYFEQALKIEPGYERASRNLANCRHALDSMNARPR